MKQEIAQFQTSAANHGGSDVAVTPVLFEHVREPLGIGTAHPRLSWTIETEHPGWHQAAYEIRLFGPDGDLREQTGCVESSKSVLVPWPFTPLESRELVTVQARVFDVDGQPSEWSKSASVNEHHCSELPSVHRPHAGSGRNHAEAGAQSQSAH